MLSRVAAVLNVGLPAAWIEGGRRALWAAEGALLVLVAFCALSDMVVFGHAGDLQALSSELGRRAGTPLRS